MNVQGQRRGPGWGGALHQGRLQGAVLAEEALEAQAVAAGVVALATARAVAGLPALDATVVSVQVGGGAIGPALGVCAAGALLHGAVGATVPRLALAAVHLLGVPCGNRVVRVGGLPTSRIKLVAGERNGVLARAVARARVGAHGCRGDKGKRNEAGGVQ